MKKISLLILFVLISTANAQVPLYRIESKAFGAPFDLVVDEVKHENAKSYLKITGFNTRTAPGTRWLFCIYTGLAMRRNYQFWTIQYPAMGDDLALLAYSNDGTVSPKDVLGSEYVKERSIGGESMNAVAKFKVLCGM